MKLLPNTHFAQAYSAVCYVQIGATGLVIGHRNGPCASRLELFTPARWFSLRLGRHGITLRRAAAIRSPAPQGEEGK